MRKIFCVVLTFILLASTLNANALEITSINADNSYLIDLGRDTEKDLQYIKTIAFSYSDRYIVKEQQYIDCSPIDKLYKDLSTPLTLEEIDSGRVNISVKRIGTKEYQARLQKFKILAGLCGIKSEFEPTAFYSIYRDVSLIGGYVCYSGEMDLEKAYWNYITNIEGMTKEIIPYSTRLLVKDNIQKLLEFIQTDNSFKIFVLKKGELDSMFSNEEVGNP